MHLDRPVLQLEPSRLERVADGVALTGLVVMLAIVGATLLFVEGPIPTHLNAAGEPDAWGSKAVLVIVVIPAFLSSTMLWALRGAPHTFNYPVVVTPENAPRLYRNGRDFVAVMGASLAWTFALVAGSIAGVGAGLVASVGVLLPAILAITFVPMGVFVWRMRRQA